MGHRGRRDRRDWASFRHAPWWGTGATVGAVIAVTWRTFVTRPGGGTPATVGADAAL